MTNHQNMARQQQFAEHWQLWAALHHFLTAPLLREFLVVIVQQVSPRAVPFDQLFDDAMSAAPDEFASWLVRPRGSTDPLEGYLQSRVNSLLWQNDAPCFVSTDTDSAIVTKASLLELATQISSLDFGALEQLSSRAQQQSNSSDAQPSFTHFIAVLRACGLTVASSHDGDLPRELIPLLDSLPPPLNAVAAKHLGDLYADVDAWPQAALLYNRAADQIERPLPDWASYQLLLATILTQSRAGAVRHLQGAAPAEALLSTLLVDTSAPSNPLAVANAAFDARVFHRQSSDSFESVRQYQSALLLPPLVHRTHELSGALQAWLNGDFAESQIQFWAVLRRQVALGSSIEAQISKAFYARSIVDRLEDRHAEKLTAESFQLAVRLLIESGDVKCAAAIRWHQSVIDRFVDEACASRAEGQAGRYAASAAQRQHVLVLLFRSWCEMLAPDRAGIAHTLLKCIANMAQDGQSSTMQSRNLGGEALEALTHIAERRPEWCRPSAAEVAAAIIAKVTHPEFWSARVVALETAIAYARIEALPEDQLRGLVNCVLDMADQIQPATQNWLLVGRALTLLTTAPVKRLARLAPALGQRIVATILRFGGPEASERTRVMFYLHDFDATLLSDESIARQLQGNVAELRQRARQINASYVAENVLALLLAPAISSQDGVKEAIECLGAIIISALKQRSASMGLPNSYQSLLLLAENQASIARDLRIADRELKLWLQPLFTQVISLWNHAKERPEIFASFSLPPNDRPNLVAVHNWTYASLVFAQSLDASGAMRAALEEAAANPALTNAISLGRSTRSLSERDHDYNLDAVLSDGGQAFYDSLGRRLALLLLINEDHAQELCKALLTQCFRHGPRILDAAVLLAASRLNLTEFIKTCDYANYSRKLDNDRDTKLALEPLIAPLIESARQRN